MPREHIVQYDEETSVYRIFRVAGPSKLILAEFSLSDVIGDDFDESVDAVAKRIGEIIFLDSKSGVLKAQKSDPRFSGN